MTESLFSDKIVFTSPTIFLTNQIMRLTYHYLGVYSLTHITTNHREASSSADSDMSDRCQWGEGGNSYYSYSGVPRSVMLQICQYAGFKCYGNHVLR